MSEREEGDALSECKHGTPTNRVCQKCIYEAMKPQMDRRDNKK